METVFLLQTCRLGCRDTAYSSFEEITEPEQRSRAGQGWDLSITRSCLMVIGVKVTNTTLTL